jgi:hypothetical protein
MDTLMETRRCDGSQSVQMEVEDLPERVVLTEQDHLEALKCEHTPTWYSQRLVQKRKRTTN